MDGWVAESRGGQVEAETEKRVNTIREKESQIRTLSRLYHSAR